MNLPYDASGTLVRTNGFGAVTSVRNPRNVQLLARFECGHVDPSPGLG